MYVLTVYIDTSLQTQLVTRDFLYARQITSSDALLQPLKALRLSEW
jgi:hypothetical protein